MFENMYSTKKFTEIYETLNDFIYDYNNIGIPKIISVENCTTLYYLLYAKFGNSPIANYDETQFKFKLFSIIWQFGPAWEKRLDIQTKVRALGSNPNDLSDILQGSKSIFNHALNPGEIAAEGASSTTNQPELQYINDQNVTNYTKSKMDAYMQLWDLIDTDVTNDFLNRFTKLFKQFVRPGTYLYEEDDSDE